MMSKTCSDFPNAPGCCDSCHEDQDMGYGMVELYVDCGDGVDAIVCCRVAEHIARASHTADYAGDHGADPSR